jgi:hypothetical protein
MRRKSRSSIVVRPNTRGWPWRWFLLGPWLVLFQFRIMPNSGNGSHVVSDDFSFKIQMRAFEEGVQEGSTPVDVNPESAAYPICTT